MQAECLNWCGEQFIPVALRYHFSFVSTWLAFKYSPLSLEKIIPVLFLSNTSFKGNRRGIFLIPLSVFGVLILGWLFL